MSEEMKLAEAEEQVQEEAVEVTLDSGEEEKPVQQNLDLGDQDKVVVEQESEPDELDDYSKGVQRRIKKLTADRRRAERDKEEAARYAESLKKENEGLKSKLTNLDQGFLTEYGTRIESQLDTAKRALKEAHDTGNVDAMVEAQQALAKIAIEQERHRLATDRVEKEPVQEQQVQEQPVQPQAAKPHPKAEEWAEKNSWFGDDEIMTQAAFVIDNKLREEGFDGTEDEYYSQLDARLKERFPNELSSKKTGEVQESLQSQLPHPAVENRGAGPSS